jgi:DNA polymerase V
MRVKKQSEIKHTYKFEAPFVSASARSKAGEKMIEGNLDILEFLAPRPESLYLVKVNGESMKDEHIYDSDVLIVDRDETPRDGLIVIAALNGELLVKTYRIINGDAYLFSANSNFLPIKILPVWDLQIQGVVKHVIRNM